MVLCPKAQAFIRAYLSLDSKKPIKKVRNTGDNTCSTGEKMTILRSFLNAVLVATIASQIVACSPIIETRGNMVSPNKVSAITPGVSGKADVASYWGPPTTVAPFDKNVWYYIGETTSQKGIFEQEVDKRQMIRVTFDPTTDMVAQVAAVDAANGRDIAMIDRKTPTAGKEFTVFQQFVGNLGKFNSSSSDNARP